MSTNEPDNRDGYDCSVCGKTLETEHGKSSHESQAHDVDFTVEVDCVVCGTTVERNECDLDEGQDIFCSTDCRSEHLSGRTHDQELIEGGRTDLWIMFTLVVVVVYAVSDYLHEGVDDQLDDIQADLDELEDR